MAHEKMKRTLESKIYIAPIEPQTSFVTLLAQCQSMHATYQLVPRL